MNEDLNQWFKRFKKNMNKRIKLRGLSKDEAEMQYMKMKLIFDTYVVMTEIRDILKKGSLKQGLNSDK